MEDDTELSVMMSKGSLEGILHALRIGREALLECEVLMESSESVMAEGWNDVDRASHEHEVKIVDGEIEYLEELLDDEEWY